MLKVITRNSDDQTGPQPRGQAWSPRTVGPERLDDRDEREDGHRSSLAIRWTRRIGVKRAYWGSHAEHVRPLAYMQPSLPAEGPTFAHHDVEPGLVK